MALDRLKIFNASKGFSLKFSSLDTLTDCGGHLTADNGIIMSPGYPSGYDNNLVCFVQIQFNIASIPFCCIELVTLARAHYIINFIYKVSILSN